MAVIRQSFDKSAGPHGGAIVATWTPVTEADTCDPVELAEYSDKTFQVFGNFGAGGTIVIEGSNDGTNWAPISNRQGTAMSFAALGMNTSQDRPRYARWRVSAGTGVSVTVSVICHRADLGSVG